MPLSDTRPWLAHYPDGVPAEVAVPAISLVDLLETACRDYGPKAAYVSFGRTLTYADWLAAAQSFASWLQGQGVGKGDRVALMLPNLLQYPIALLGSLQAGAVVVSCNPLYTARELGLQLRDSGATVVVILENFAHVLEAALTGTAVRHVVVTSVGELLGRWRGACLDFLIRRVKRAVPAWRLPGAIRFADALAAGRQRGLQAVSLGQDDLAFLQYTGGTTGTPKGAMLSHGNLVANVTQACAWIGPVIKPGQEVILTALPLYHVFALTANCLTFARIGACNVLIANPRDIAGLIATWRRHPITALTGVNTLFKALLQHPRFASLDFSALKVTLGGGMAVQAPVAEAWLAATGVPLLQAYGLTETSPAVTVDPLDLPAFNGAIGLPLPSTWIDIRNDAGQSLPLGEVGEICVKGPQVMQGYWQQPGETALVLGDDGYLRTGDLGYVGAEGYVYLVDRKKDLILVSGFKVYPNEVEEVVVAHPGVADAAAVGVPDARSGEVVKLFVVRRDPALSSETLITHCQGLLTAYKVPRHVVFCDSLPRNPLGKILRRALRDLP